ncbi:hypothetical protein CC78DRAFT_61885 [Lojkania enalia]|uniref:Uncharacterized protein n=1 Tax=Lojkania enalia TaxID=147567 RepID=A0A9P4N5W3_9PLEO|nr:hypothetical protein CC78DRAFT_61885 [Didymosphaeria enalia]
MPSINRHLASVAGLLGACRRFPEQCNRIGQLARESRQLGPFVSLTSFAVVRTLIDIDIGA